MSETENKYGKYFYDSMPAIQKIADDSLKTISTSTEKFLASTNSSLVKPEPEVRSKSRFDVIDPRTLVYSDRIVQNSEIMDSRIKMTVEKMVRNASNSVGNKPVVKTSTKKKNVNLWNRLSKTGKEVVSVMVVGSIMLSGYFAAKGIDDFSDSLKVDEYLEQYEDAYSENKFTVDFGNLDVYGQPKYDWDIEGMGKYIATSDDPEASLYATYSGGEYKKYDVVRDAFAVAKEINPGIFGKCKSFKEYAISLGCVDEDGNIDYERYEEIIEARLLAKQLLAENSVSEVSVK